MKVGKLSLELDVIMGGARDIAGAAGARADGVDRLMHGVAHDWVLTHAEIIVRAPHGHLAGAGFGEMLGRGIGSATALQVGEDPIAAFLMQRIEMLVEAILVVHLNLNPLRLQPFAGFLSARQPSAQPECRSSNSKQQDIGAAALT